jgi:hypothetical protein
VRESLEARFIGANYGRSSGMRGASNLMLKCWNFDVGPGSASIRFAVQEVHDPTLCAGSGRAVERSRRSGC